MVKKRTGPRSRPLGLARLPAPNTLSARGAQTPLKHDSETVLDQVVDKIRKRQVVLWTGSGFNCASGLPTGSQLAQIIRADCTAEQQKEITLAGDYLPRVAEKYLRMRPRQELASLLKKALSPKQPDLTLHNFVRGIKQINEIVTTNYDKLLEASLGTELGVVYRDADLPIIQTYRRLYKVHGDLDDPDTIVISESDYAKFLTEPENPLVWMQVTTLMASKTRLFVGYSLDDVNTIDLLTRVQLRLGSNCPESYLIARSVSPYEVERLVGLHVRVVQEDALSAMTYIYQGVLSHILEDCVNDPRGYDLLGLLQTQGAAVKMTNDGQKSILSLKAPADITFDAEARLRLGELYSDPSRDGLLLPADSVTVRIKLKDFTIPLFWLPGQDISVERVPTQELVGHLALLRDPAMTVPVKVMVYRNDRVTLDHPCLRIDWFPGPVNPHYDCQWRPQKDIYVAHQAFHLLQGMLDSEHIQLVVREPAASYLLQGGPLPETPKREIDRVRALHRLCDDLVRISSHFGVTLELPTTLTPEDACVLDAAIAIMRGEPASAREIDVCLVGTIDRETLDALSGQNYWYFESPIRQVLFGKEVALGIIHAEVPHAMLMNREEVQNSLVSGGSKVHLKIRSTSGRIALTYRPR